MHDIVATMVKRFQQEANAIGLLGTSTRIVTMASIVEKESASPKSVPIVASVYYNRLPGAWVSPPTPPSSTPRYCGGNYRGTIYQSDLQADSPYNTYKYAGLPPGPIANPGASALKAAMNPATDRLPLFRRRRQQRAPPFQQHLRGA